MAKNPVISVHTYDVLYAEAKIEQDVPLIVRVDLANREVSIYSEGHQDEPTVSANVVTLAGFQYELTDVHLDADLWQIEVVDAVAQYLIFESQDAISFGVREVLRNVRAMMESAKGGTVHLLSESEDGPIHSIYHTRADALHHQHLGFVYRGFAHLDNLDPALVESSTTYRPVVAS